jgi:hypothetical protein
MKACRSTHTLPARDDTCLGEGCGDAQVNIDMVTLQRDDVAR